MTVIGLRGIVGGDEDGSEREIGFFGTGGGTFLDSDIEREMGTKSDGPSDCGRGRPSIKTQSGSVVEVNGLAGLLTFGLCPGY